MRHPPRGDYGEEAGGGYAGQDLYGSLSLCGDMRVEGVSGWGARGLFNLEGLEGKGCGPRGILAWLTGPGHHLLEREETKSISATALFLSHSTLVLYIYVALSFSRSERERRRVTRGCAYGAFRDGEVRD